jgi:hypothetical protein
MHDERDPEQQGDRPAIRCQLREVVRGALPTVVDLLLLSAFWVLFFWAILVRRDHFIPYDLIDQHYMFQQFIHHALRSGEAPWWSPSVVGGYPIIADPLSALFYPPNFLMHLLIPRDLLPYLALEGQSTLHLLWAAFGMYFLARHLTGTRAGGVLAGLAWGFGAFFVWHMTQLSPISSLSWLPWVLLAYSKAVRQRSLLWVSIGALAFGMLALAGHALTILGTGYLVVGITVVLVWNRWSLDRRSAVRTALCGFLILLLGTGLAMVQLLPSYAFSGQTERAGFAYEAASAASYLPQWLVTAFVPNFFSYRGPAAYWASGDVSETNLYLGLIPLFLAVLGVSRARRSDDRRMTAWLVAGAIISLVFAFGSNAWLHHLAFDLLPGFDRVRRPGDAIALVQFAVVLLAAFGVKALREPLHARRSARTLAAWLRWTLIVDVAAIILVALALAASVGQTAQPPLTTVLNGLVMAGIVILAAFLVVRLHLAGRMTLRGALALLLLITAIDLGSAFAGVVYQNSASPPNTYIGADWASGASGPVVQTLLMAQKEALPGRYRMFPGPQIPSVWANGPLVWGIESASGYVVLCPKHYCDLLNAADADPGSPLFDLLNIRYLLVGKPLDELYPGSDTQRFQLISDGPIRVYEDPSAFPRVWVAQKAVYEPDDQAIAYLQANATSLGDTVVLSTPPTETTAKSPTTPATTQIVRYENTRVSIRASLAAPGYVVLADSYAPGWEVRVDGKRAHLYRADVALRAVWVPAGTHEIDYTYHLPGLRAGAILSVVSLVVIIALVPLEFLFRRSGLLVR